jgi:preprotein translocase subunit SecF
MMKKFLKLVLACLLVSTQAGAPVFAADQSSKDAQTPEQVKINVNRAGIGEKARVTVRMKDGTKRKGYVSERHDEDFVLRDRKTDAASTIAYRDVSKIGIDRGHSTARNTTIGVAIGVGAVVLVLAALFASIND